jgi:hypothetical protein
MSTSIISLRGLFDQDRMAEAIAVVLEDRRRFDVVSLGQALGARLLGALHEQDMGTLARGLAVVLDDSEQDVNEEAIRWIAATRAGALSIDLSTELSGLDPKQPTAAGVPSEDVAEVVDGLATILAGHGFRPEQIFSDALASPLDVPGALYLPACALQLLFAYIDQEGLGPYMGQSIGELVGGGPAAAASLAVPVEVPVYA